VLCLIEGIADATASLLKLFSGVIVDRARRGKAMDCVRLRMAS